MSLGDRMLDPTAGEYKIDFSSPILAIINPHSGSGQALKIFETIVKPIWQKMGVPYEIIQTRYAGQCTELIKNDHDIKYSGYIAVGGDGTFSEVVNGFMARQSTEKAVQMVSLGIIPVGSGNGLSKSLHVHANRKFTVEEAAKMIAALATKKLDLFTVSQIGLKRYSFLVLAAGLIADIDIKTEWMRCLGQFRYILGAIKSIWDNKSYQATLSYLPENSELDISESSANPPSDNLSKLSGRFTMIMIGKTSHCSSNAHTLPGACMDDGYLYVAVVKVISRLALLRLLLKLESGNWINDPYVSPSVERFRTKLIRVEEIPENMILTVDGERVPSIPTECRINKEGLRVLCSSPTDK